MTEWDSNPQPFNSETNAKWLSVRLRIKWLWVRVPLQSLREYIVFLCILLAQYLFCNTKEIFYLFYRCILHDVFYKAVDYWIEKLINGIPLLKRLTKAFILEGLLIILEFNYFYINDFTSKSEELLWELFEEKMYAILPQIYPKDFVSYLLFYL